MNDSINEPAVHDGKETFMTVKRSYLQAMMDAAKSDDFTRSQFEKEKTQRIASLAEALKNEPSGSGYRNQIAEKLLEICEEKFVPNSIL